MTFVYDRPYKVMYAIRTPAVLNQFWHNYKKVEPYPRMYARLEIAKRKATMYSRYTNRKLQIVQFDVSEPTVVDTEINNVN